MEPPSEPSVIIHDPELNQFKTSNNNVNSELPSGDNQSLDHEASPNNQTENEAQPKRYRKRCRGQDESVVQALSESSDFTVVADLVENVTTNKSQEPTVMSVCSSPDNMILCPGKGHEYTEPHRTRLEAVTFIRTRTLTRLFTTKAILEERCQRYTSEKALHYIEQPGEVATTPTEGMDPSQEPKGKKKKAKKKKLKKTIPFDGLIIGGSSSQLTSPNDCLMSTRSLTELTVSASHSQQSGRRPSPFSSIPTTDLTRPELPKLPESGVEPGIHRIPMSDKDAQDMCKPGREEGPAVDHVSRCITYRDALLGTLAPKHKDRVPETDITVKIEVTEHDAALHAHPHSLAHVMARDLAAEMTFKQHENSSIEEISKVKDHTSYREWEAVTTTDPTISSTQDEERSSTGSPTSVSSTQSSLSNHPIRKIKIPVREKLSPIKEVSSEATRIFYGDESPSQQAEKDSTSDESQSYLVCTPRSSKTTSTGWTSAGPLDTPQMKPFETGPTEKTTASFHAISSHAHPSSSAQGDKTTQNTTTPSEFVSIQKPDSFFWQLDSHGFQCAKAECEKCCNLWDGESVICPRCGPFSEVRYCCKEHLLDDIKWHWLYCEQMTFEHPCRESSIPLDVRNGPPFVPCLHAYDTPERHRQAVYFAANHNMGDYFIFSDWIDMMEAGFPENNPELRCSNRVIYRIAFNDANEKDRFRRVLATCLFMTIEVVELVDYLFRLIRDKLRSENAPPELETALKWQFFEEFAVMIQQQISGERHACTTDWDGRNRRICRDAVCRGEYRRLLGTLGGKGHRQLIGHLEGSYWILRAARTTHPTVHDPRARMRGEGFEDVAEEDRREFRRGAGWDGAGTGEMEIEGIND